MKKFEVESRKRGRGLKVVTKGEKVGTAAKVGRGLP